MDKLSERRLVENEVIFRESNKSIAEFIEETDAVAASTPLRFFCECSKTECRERIELSPEEYKELHQNNRQFIILVGHEMPKIEKVVEQKQGFNIIEKFMSPPSLEELNLAVKNIRL